MVAMTAPQEAASGAENSETLLSLARFSIPPIEAFVRELQESDNLALEWHGGLDLRSFYEAQWARYQNREATVLVVDWNGYPIAQAAIYWQGKPTHPGIPDIQSFRVFPAFRRMGIGSHLLQACEHLVASRGHAEVSLSVGLENPRAHALYERKGYQPAGEPYLDEWSYTDWSGQERTVSETIKDLIKSLSPSS
jgi:ribosomal protein S18 acetylase RimI-like enzyme